MEQSIELEERVEGKLEERQGFSSSYEDIGRNLMRGRFQQQAASTQQPMFAVNNEALSNFFREAFDGNLNKVQFLWQEADDTERKQMLEISEYAVFRGSISYDRVEVVKFLWEKANNKQREEMLERDNFYTFRLAAVVRHRGSTAYCICIANFLWEQATPEQRKKMANLNSHEFLAWYDKRESVILSSPMQKGLPVLKTSENDQIETQKSNENNQDENEEEQFLLSQSDQQDGCNPRCCVLI